MQQKIEKFPRAEADGWQLYHTVAPHRSVSGPLVFGWFGVSAERAVGFTCKRMSR